MLKDMILLDMLRSKVLKIEYDFINQSIIKSRTRFYNIMSCLETDGYINRIKDRHKFRHYTLTDKGFLLASLKTTDKETPRKYQKLLKGVIHYTFEN